MCISFFFLPRLTSGYKKEGGVSKLSCSRAPRGIALKPTYKNLIDKVCPFAALHQVRGQGDFDTHPFFNTILRRVQELDGLNLFDRDITDLFNRCLSFC